MPLLQALASLLMSSQTCSGLEVCIVCVLRSIVAPLRHLCLPDSLVSHPQWLHRLEVGITRGAEGKTGRAFVGDMSEEKAVELASKVVSEGFLYSVRSCWRGCEVQLLPVCWQQQQEATLELRLCCWRLEKPGCGRLSWDALTAGRPACQQGSSGARRPACMFLISNAHVLPTHPTLSFADEGSAGGGSKAAIHEEDAAFS